MIMKIIIKLILQIKIIRKLKYYKKIVKMANLSMKIYLKKMKLMNYYRIQ